MDINWLEDFVCFGRHLSFTAAANERNITQSAFSRRIQSLEYWAGTELVDRKTYPACLSNAGEEFLPVAKSILLQLHRTRDELQTKASLGNGIISFAAPHAASIHRLTPLLRQIEAVIPDVRTRVMSDDLHTCCEIFSQGLCEFLMCYRHSHIPLTLDEQRFQRLDLSEERLIPICSRKLAEGVGKTVEDRLGTAKFPYLAYPPGSFLGAVVERILAGKKVSPMPSHIDSFSEALKSLALSGTGVAWLPETSIQGELRNGSLVIAADETWTVPLTLSVFSNHEKRVGHAETVWSILTTKHSEV